MDIYLFEEAAAQLAKISRTLKQSQGNALLLGSEGTGRQSLAKLATYIVEYELFEVLARRNYGKEEWREDLKKVVKIAGLQGRQVLFIFRDSQIVMESFLEDISNLIHSGQVPDLFVSEEIDSITHTLLTSLSTTLNLPNRFANSSAADLGIGQRANQQGDLSSEILYSSFVNQVKKNLHIVICLDPSDSAFKTRIRNFPALTSCCAGTCRWF
jgi:dynein heavy chain